MKAKTYSVVQTSILTLQGLSGLYHLSSSSLKLLDPVTSPPSPSLALMLTVPKGTRGLLPIAPESAAKFPPQWTIHGTWLLLSESWAFPFFIPLLVDYALQTHLLSLHLHHSGPGTLS